MPKKRKRKKPQPPAPAKSRADAKPRAQAESQAKPQAAPQAEPQPQVESQAQAEPQAPPAPPSWLAYLAVLLIATPWLAAPYKGLGIYNPPLHMGACIQILGLLCLALFALACPRRAQIQLPRSPALLPLLAFYCWAMLSCLWARGKYQAMLDALDWTGALLAAVFVMLAVRDARGLRLALGAIAASGAALCLLGAGQYLLGLDWVGQAVAPAAVFSNKNLAAQFAILTLPVAAALFLFAKDRLLVWACALAAAVICAFIVHAHAKGVWVAFAAELAAGAAALIYLKARHGCAFMRGRDKKIAAGVAAALFAALAYTTPAMLGTTAADEKTPTAREQGVARHATGAELIDDALDSRLGSANVRFTMWMNSVPMFRDHFLLGVGLGNWANHYPAYQSWFKQDFRLLRNRHHANAHNDYIEILCELGVVGFALFAWLLVGAARLVGRTLANFSEARGDALMLGPSVALFGIAVAALFSFPLKHPALVFLVLTHIALLSRHATLHATTPGGAARAVVLPPRPIMAVAAAVLLSAAGAASALQFNFYQAEVHRHYAAAHLQAEQFAVAEEHARLGRARSPLNEKLLWLHATALMELERDADAVPLFEEALRVRPHDANPVLNLSIAYDRLGKSAEAIALLEDFVRVQPINYTQRIRLAKALARSARFDEAAAQLEQGRARLLKSIARRRAAGRKIERQTATIAEFEQLLQAVEAAKAQREEDAAVGAH